jgi:AraC-like DNA-binding protein
MLSKDTKSLLLYPPKQLAGCIAAGIFRDTRNTSLSDMDRFNYFPASPLISVTYVIDGEIRLVGKADSLDDAKQAIPIAPQSITLPCSQPIISWSPAPVTALTLAFYPDAWQKLGYDLEADIVPADLASALSCFHACLNPDRCWAEFGQSFSPHWNKARNVSGSPHWAGSDRLADWSRYHLGRLSLVSAAGRSIRTIERQIKRMSGQTKQSLNFYSAIEDLHKLTVISPENSLADIAVEAGFSDQSHMGRAVRRATGFSPAKLNQLIETEEPFWCYRLLGERF